MNNRKPNPKLIEHVKSTYVPDIWQGMNLDEINQCKQELQDLMPLVELLKIKGPPNELPGLERDQKLAFMGYSRSEIQKMTGYDWAD